MPPAPLSSRRYRMSEVEDFLLLILEWGEDKVVWALLKVLGASAAEAEKLAKAHRDRGGVDDRRADDMAAFAEKMSKWARALLGILAIAGGRMLFLCVRTSYLCSPEDT